MRRFWSRLVILAIVLAGLSGPAFARFGMRAAPRPRIQIKAPGAKVRVPGRAGVRTGAQKMAKAMGLRPRPGRYASGFRPPGAGRPGGAGTRVGLFRDLLKVNRGGGSRGPGSIGRVRHGGRSTAASRIARIRPGGRDTRSARLNRPQADRKSGGQRTLGFLRSALFVLQGRYADTKRNRERGRVGQMTLLAGNNFWAGNGQKDTQLQRLINNLQGRYAGGVRPDGTRRKSGLFWISGGYSQKHERAGELTKLAGNTLAGGWGVSRNNGNEAGELSDINRAGRRAEHEAQLRRDRAAREDAGSAEGEAARQTRARRNRDAREGVDEPPAKDDEEESVAPRERRRQGRDRPDGERVAQAGEVGERPRRERDDDEIRTGPRPRRAGGSTAELRERSERSAREGREVASRGRRKRRSNEQEGARPGETAAERNIRQAREDREAAARGGGARKSRPRDRRDRERDRDRD